MTTAARSKLMRMAVLMLTIVLVISSLSLGLIVVFAPFVSATKSSTFIRERTVQDLSQESREVETPVERNRVLQPPQVSQPSELVQRVVAAESRSESLEGQMAVAQTIYETALATGKSWDEVVLTPNQYADPISADMLTDSIREACYRVFVLGEKVTEEPIRWFYSTAGGFYSRWHETSSNLEYVMSIGVHKFYKLAEEAQP